MFDLNEIPEHPSDHLVAVGDLKTAPVADEAGATESKPSCNGLLPFLQKDLDHSSTVTQEKSAELPALRSPIEQLSTRSSVDLLPSRSSLSSSLTFEPSQAPRRQNGNGSKAAIVHEEDDVQNGDELGLTSNLLQRKQHQKQLQQQEILQGTDLYISPQGSTYQFLSGEASTSKTYRVSAEASTSRAREDLLDNCEDECKISSLFPLQKTKELQILLGNGHGQEELQSSSLSTDGSGIRLSLGGSSLNSRTPRTQELTRCSSSSLKRADAFGLALGRPDDRSLLSTRKSSDLSPFWSGKLRTDAPLLTPVDAYCLGIMKPDSRLKKLPAILSSQKFVKREEYIKSVLSGVMEPLTQFKPSLDATLEEVNRFNLMVEALSHGSGLAKSSSVLGLDLGRKKLSVDGTFPYSAALISWEEDADHRSGARLYLVSFQSFQELVKHGQLDGSFGPLEELVGLDSDSLYGIFCSTSGHSNDKVIPQKAGERDAGISKATTTNKRSDSGITTSASFGDKGKDMLLLNGSGVPRGSPPRNKRHIAQTELLIKSASMDSKRVSSRDSIPKSDSERGSKRRLERHSSSIDAVHSVGGKRLSRHSNGNDDLYEDDIDMLSYQKALLKQREKPSWNSERHFQRQDLRSERIKDTARWSKEDRDTGKNRIKEHQRSSHHENERGWKSKTKEEHSRDHDKHRERDKSSRDLKVTESSKAKLLERSSSRSKGSSVRKDSPDHVSGKPNKKREREDEKENNVNAKRVKELEVLDSRNSVKEMSCDLKPRIAVDQVGKEEGLLQIQQEQVEKLPSIELNKEYINSNNTVIKPFLGAQDGDGTKPLLGVADYDGIAEEMDKGSVLSDEELTKPLLGHGLFDCILEAKQEVSDIPACETEGVSEMETDYNVLKLSVMESAWDDGLGESLTVQAEKQGVVETSLDFLLDGSIDKETRTWLMSKQNTLYLQEEYGVDVSISSGNSDILKCDSGAKADIQNGPLQVRISMAFSEACDDVEAKWFMEQAACIVKSIALRGVYVKCLWYEGPVQIHPGDGAPSVPAIVKKIKGEDGKNLERMQDETGVMIGVVLRKSGVLAPTEAEPMSRPRFIGLRLKCIRRKGLLEASKEGEALLESVAEHFSKELATHIATHIADLQESAVHYGEGISNQDSPLSLALSTKELLPNSPVKVEGQFNKSSPGSLKEDETLLAASTDKSTPKISSNILVFSEEREAISVPRRERVSRPLFVSNLPDPTTSIKIQNIFESVLREKLDLSGEFGNVLDMVVDVKYKPDRYCAFVELANDDVLKASLKLYAEDKTVFRGMTVEEGLVAFPKTDRQGSFARGGVRIKVSNSGEHIRSSSLGRTTEVKGEDQESDSDRSQDVWYDDSDAMRSEYLLNKPRPLYLTELMRNASAPAIKQLFENIITTYIGPSLVNSSGKQLILDVRYVPTRGCAFVDLATPELVDFMLDLHSRRPEVFMNMKMELGRKAVPYSIEDDGDRRLSLRSRDSAPQFGARPLGYRLTSSASWKKLEKRSSGTYIDYLEEFDKGEDLIRQMSRMKKQRSDPEKTIYADRLPESASEGMIKKIFERVLLQNLTQEEVDAFGEQLITEVRHVPTKYCAFVVFATEDLTRLVLQLYNQDEDIFECMRLKPHFHSRLEDLYKEDAQEIDDVVRSSASFRERAVSNDIDEFLRLRESEVHDSRSSRLAVQRAISATAFKEVDRRRSVYVDRIPEELNESSMTQLFEKVFRHKKLGHEGPMVSQVAYFRDKFDPSKLCAFVEVKTEEGTQDLVDCYNTNQDIFQGMRIRPGFKYNT